MKSIHSPNRSTAPLRTSGRISSFSLLALVAACASPRVATVIEVPDRFTATPAAASTDETVTVRWWQRFADLTLDGLMNEAASANRDVRAALARAELARAGLQTATADLLPSVEAVAARKEESTTYSAAIRQQLPDIHGSQTGLQTSWEIDLFGRARAARRAAKADALAAADAHRGALLLVLSDTAEQYFVLRGAQAQRQIVAELIEAERETLRLTELRRERGSASDFDLDRARGELADTEALAPRLDTLITTTRNRIAVLIGRPPGRWVDPVTGVPRPIAVPAIPASQPADLLRRRPDVMAADASLAAAGFRHDEARASQFPQFLVSALVGSQWTDVNALDIGRARFTNAAGALALPLFAGGRIRGGIAAADASQREAVARYEQTLLRALEDVEGTVTSYVNDTRRNESLQSAIDSRNAALLKVKSLYQAGEADLLQVLDVERGLLSSRLDGAATQTARLIDVVLTYKALGGGWEAFDGTARAKLVGSPQSRPTD